MVGALGIAIAHSGTVMSVLLDPDSPRFRTQEKEIEIELTRLDLDAEISYEIA